MIRFKKYSSIENAFNEEFIEKVKANMPADLEYVVQEKVHGSNTCFICNGTEMRFAKRTALLEEGEKFFDFEELVARYRSRVFSAYERVRKNHPEAKSVTLFGEMFGGKYPHPDVAAVRDTVLIQKGVYYTPNHEFYGFDIYISEEETGRFLPIDEANEVFEAEGFIYSRTIFRGSLDQCLAHPNSFQSKISEWIGLPQIEGNICEGVVIKPVVPMYLPNGDRVIIKNKNEVFAEKKSVKKRNKIFCEPVPKSELLEMLLQEVDDFITENRLTNVVSHIGEVEFPRDLGKVSGMFAKDVFDDFFKERGAQYTAMDKYEQKELNKAIAKLATTLVKTIYMSN